VKLAAPAYRRQAAGPEPGMVQGRQAQSGPWLRKKKLRKVE